MSRPLGNNTLRIRRVFAGRTRGALQGVARPIRLQLLLLLLIAQHAAVQLFFGSSRKVLAGVSLGASESIGSSILELLASASLEASESIGSYIRQLLDVRPCDHVDFIYSFYSLVPSIYCTLTMLQCIQLWLRGWPEHGSRVSISWKPPQRQQMSQLMRCLKILGLCAACFAIAFFKFLLSEVTHHELLRQHLANHEMHEFRHLGLRVLEQSVSSFSLNSAVPGIKAMFAGSLLTISMLDHMIDWTFAHLTRKRRDYKEPYYTEIQLERLGNMQCGTDRFVSATASAMIFLIPVPMAEVALEQLSQVQAVLAFVEGLLAGLLFHVAFVRYFGALGGRRSEILQRWLLIPVLRLRRLLCCCCCCCLCRARRDDSLPDTQTSWARGLSSAEHEFTDQLEQLRKAHRERLRGETKAYEEQALALHSKLPDTLKQRRRMSFSEETSKLETTSGGCSCCLSWLASFPGLEFLAIKHDNIFHSADRTEHELEMAEAGNELLKQRLEEANEEIQAHEKELQEQAQAVEMERQVSIQFQRTFTEQMAEAESQQKMALEQIKEESLAAQEAQRAEIMASHSAHAEAMQLLKKQAMEELRLAQEETERQWAVEMAARKDSHDKAMELLRQQATEDLEKANQQTLKEQQLRQEFVRRANLQVAQARQLHERALAQIREETKKATEQAQEENTRQIEAEKKRQGLFVQQLISFAQALMTLLDAAKEGDRKALDMELENMRNVKDAMPEDAIRRLAGPLIQQASDTQREWIRRLCDLRDGLEKARSYGGTDMDSLSRLARQLFAAVTAVIDSGLDLRKHDMQLCMDSEKWLFERWLSNMAQNHHDASTGVDVANLQRRIVHKAILSSKEDLGNFDFTDLEACTEIVDCNRKTYIDLARVQIEHNPPKTLARALSQLNALIYFLDYLEKEDLTLAKDVFGTYINKYGDLMGNEVKYWVLQACNKYTQENVLLRKEDLMGIKDKKPADVIQQMSMRQCPALGKLHRVFCKLAMAWEQDFQVLSVPHHSQVLALLVFKIFLEDPQSAVQTLIAQVSTGEGKSMLIAVLAALVCSSMGKKVHVVGNDRKLVLRDFEQFRALFREIAAEVAPEQQADRFAVVCGDPKQAANKSDVVQSIPDDAWIVYCEARHVTSFYTNKARRGELHTASLKERVLIMDEVDALVIDEDPTDHFVYDISWRLLSRGITLGDYVTQVARCIARGEPCPESLEPSSELEEQTHSHVVYLMEEVEKWGLKPKGERDAEYQLYVGSDEIGLTGIYVRMVNGKADVKYQSNFLECLRMKEQLENATYKMKWYERLFVMSKPRVLQQYSKIIGLSGTIGDGWERDFLSKAYNAQFYVVPPFLETCVDVQVHTAQWASNEQQVVRNELRPVTMHVGLPSPCVVAANAEQQYKLVESLCFEVRKMVPVLVITACPEDADLVVEQLRQHARTALAGCNPSDLIRSLSQREYDRDPRVYKESLRASTQTLSKNSAGPHDFRITVTDPTGARGTDYQMNDEAADKLGGLMLVMMHVPPSRRDWIQFKGRTSRQNWRGQYCVVLSAEDYRALDHGVGRSLPHEAYHLKPGSQYVPSNPEKLVEHILIYGAEESQRKVDACEASYNAGFVANEICEKVWLRPGWHEVQTRADGVVQTDVNLQGSGRKAFAELCSHYMYMTAQELQDASRKITGPGGDLDFSLEHDSKVPNRLYQPLPLPASLARRRKAVLVLVDVSGSMTTNRIGPEMTRLDVCKLQLRSILTNDNIICEGDHVGVVAFGAGQRRLIPGSAAHIVGPKDPLAVKALVDEGQLETAQKETVGVSVTPRMPVTRLSRGRQTPPHGIQGIGSMNLQGFGAGERAQLPPLGMYTFLYSTLMNCLQELVSPAHDAFSRWVILLCDGDDTEKKPEEEARCLQTLRQFGRGFNLIIISVGSDVTRGPLLQSFADEVAAAGSVGKYIAATNEEDDTAVRRAFAQVEKSLAMAGDGQTEA